MRPVRFMTIWLLVALSLLRSSASAHTGESGADLHPPACNTSHELWLISTRHLCFPDWNHPATYDLDVRQYTEQAGWVDSTLAEFLAAEQKLTVVYVHANRWDWEDAFSEGQFIYQSVRSCASAGPPIRFVIWTWPSDRIPGPIRDVRVKAERADAEGSYFGWFLSQLPSGTPVSLIGFSYGARIISGGLHLLGGGYLNGHVLPVPTLGADRPIRAVYLAAAMDREWLLPNGYHAYSLSVLDELLITYNCCDPALKRFRLSDPCTRPVALGYTGINRGYLGAAGSIVSQLDVAPAVGRTHNERRYWGSTSVLHTICEFAVRTMPSAIEPVVEAEPTMEAETNPAVAAVAQDVVATSREHDEQTVESPTVPSRITGAEEQASEPERRFRRPLRFLRGRR